MLINGVMPIPPAINTNGPFKPMLLKAPNEPSTTALSPSFNFPNSEVKSPDSFIEKETGVKTRIVSVGPDRDETIILVK